MPRSRLIRLRVPNYWRTSIRVTTWLAAPGAFVHIDEPLIRLGTATFSSPESGVLREHLCSEGEDVASETPVAVLEVQVRDEEHYVLQFYDETGMGKTLWAKNDAAQHRWCSWVDPEELPISPILRNDLQRVAELSAVGWQLSIGVGLEPDDSDPSLRWPTESETRELELLEESLLDRLRQELGPSYSVLEQRGTEWLLISD